MDMEQTDDLSPEAIVAALRALGLSSGVTVLAHSSLSSLGRVRGGAEAVIDALLAAVSPGGTVLVPTLTGTPRDSLACPPVFDPRTSPCWTGVVPDTFRRRPTSRRSRHPTHSVAGIGPHAATLLAAHEYCATPCAADSPYGRLADSGGLILLLGVTHASNTCLHMLEEVARVLYHLQPKPAHARVARVDGTWEEIATVLHLWRWERNFPKVEPLLRDASVQRDGLVGRAPSRLVDVGAMRETLLTVLHRDPLFLLSDAARAVYEQSAPPGAPHRSSPVDPVR